MTTGLREFRFRIEQTAGEAVMKTRSFVLDAEATAYARQLLKDWPGCASIDVLQAGELMDRLRPVTR